MSEQALNQLRRIRDNLTGHSECARLLDHAIAACERPDGPTTAAQDSDAPPRRPDRTRPAERRTAPTDDAPNWEE